MTQAVALALPGARIEENSRTTRVVWQHPCPPDGDSPAQPDSACVYVGPSGERVSVEVSAHPQGVVAMLTALAAVQQD
ncbi:hypothetical protein [Streptomyces sp. NPDC059371]|uniref:hypothetical protein n=1 Tax=Streptomyces sp. NPDC059371 TaxID=3346812 RepID=UPI0036978DDE